MGLAEALLVLIMGFLVVFIILGVANIIRMLVDASYVPPPNHDEIEKVEQMRITMSGWNPPEQKYARDRRSEYRR